MPDHPITITVQFLVGTNREGTQFCVGRVEGSPRWIGYALMPGLVYVLPGVSEGYVLGMPDRDEAIRRVGAIARDPGHGLGGIDRWCVPEGLRGDPESYRCPECGEVCCDGDHDPDFTDEDDRP